MIFFSSLYHEFNFLGRFLISSDQLIYLTYLLRLLTRVGDFLLSFIKFKRLFNFIRFRSPNVYLTSLIYLQFKCFLSFVRLMSLNVYFDIISLEFKRLVPVSTFDEWVLSLIFESPLTYNLNLFHQYLLTFFYPCLFLLLLLQRWHLILTFKIICKPWFFSLGLSKPDHAFQYTSSSLTTSPIISSFHA